MKLEINPKYKPGDTFKESRPGRKTEVFSISGYRIEWYPNRGPILTYIRKGCTTISYIEEYLDTLEYVIPEKTKTTN